MPTARAIQAGAENRASRTSRTAVRSDERSRCRPAIVRSKQGAETGPPTMAHPLDAARAGFRYVADHAVQQLHLETARSPKDPLGRPSPSLLLVAAGENRNGPCQPRR